MRLQYEKSGDINCFNDWICVCFIGHRSHRFLVCEASSSNLRLAFAYLDEQEVDFDFKMIVIITSVVLL